MDPWKEVLRHPEVEFGKEKAERLSVARDGGGSGSECGLRKQNRNPVEVPVRFIPHIEFDASTPTL